MKESDFIYQYAREDEHLRDGELPIPDNFKIKFLLSNRLELNRKRYKDEGEGEIRNLGEEPSGGQKEPLSSLDVSR